MYLCLIVVMMFNAMQIHIAERPGSNGRILKR